MKNLRIIFMLSALLIMPVATAAVDASLESVRETFLLSRETFLDDQTEVHKDQYFVDAQAYALELVRAQQDYITNVERELFDQLEVGGRVPENWLEQERVSLEQFEVSIEEAEDYARIQAIMRDNKTVWEKVRGTIQGMRVWLAYDQYEVVLLRARAVHDAVALAQSDVARQLDDAAITGVDFTAWSAVFETYTEKLETIEADFTEARGAYSERDYTTLEDDDEEWKKDVAYLEDVQAELDTLTQLQEASINQFLATVAAYVQPVVE